MPLKLNPSDIKRVLQILEKSGTEGNGEGSEDKEPGRRQYDGSTGKLVAYGVGGGSVIGILTSLFMFMNSAPWTAKGDFNALQQDVKRIEDNFKSHVDGPGHSATNAQVELLKAQFITINEKLSEMKADLKDIKDRRITK